MEQNILFSTAEELTLLFSTSLCSINNHSKKNCSIAMFAKQVPSYLSSSIRFLLYKPNGFLDEQNDLMDQANKSFRST